MDHLSAQARRGEFGILPLITSNIRREEVYRATNVLDFLNQAHTLAVTPKYALSKIKGFAFIYLSNVDIHLEGKDQYLMRDMSGEVLLNTPCLTRHLQSLDIVLQDPLIDRSTFVSGRYCNAGIIHKPSKKLPLLWYYENDSPPKEDFDLGTSLNGVNAASLGLNW